MVRLARFTLEDHAYGRFSPSENDCFAVYTPSAQRHANQRALDPMPGNDGSIVIDIFVIDFPILS